MCGGIKTIKHNKRIIMLRLAYHGYKNLAHTSKTCQVKRTLKVATARFMIRVYVTFSDC